MGDRPGGDHTRAIGITDLVGIAAIFKLPESDPPTWAEIGSTGIWGWQFEKGDRIHVYYEMDHAWQVGSEFQFHVHWRPEDTNTGTVAWQLQDYQVSSIGDALAGAGSDSGIDCYDPGSGVQFEHQMTAMHDISGVGHTVSFFLEGTLHRFDDAADTYTGDPYLMAADVHYRRARRGSDVRD